MCQTCMCSHTFQHQELCCWPAGVSTHTKKVAEEKEDEAEEEEEPAEPEEGSVGAHAAAFANKPFKRKEVSTAGRLLTQ